MAIINIFKFKIHSHFIVTIKISDKKKITVKNIIYNNNTYYLFFYFLIYSIITCSKSLYIFVYFYILSLDTSVKVYYINYLAILVTFIM